MKTVLEIDWTYSGTLLAELHELADEIAGWSDSAEEAQREFDKRANGATGAETVTFYEVKH